MMVGNLTYFWPPLYMYDSRIKIYSSQEGNRSKVFSS